MRVRYNAVRSSSGRLSFRIRSDGPWPVPCVINIAFHKNHAADIATKDEGRTRRGNAACRCREVLGNRIGGGVLVVGIRCH